MSGVPAWDDDPLVAGWSGLALLDRSVTADVCVVGLGGSGLAAVESAIERGLRVVGVDAGRVGAGAAGRNGGFLLGGPAPFLHDAIRAWGECAADLYRATLAELDHLDRVLGPAVIDRCGSIRLAGLPGEVANDEAADCAALAAALRAHGIAVRDYDGDLGRGIYLPDDAATNPARRVVSTAALLRERADLYEGSPVRSVASGAVETDRGRVSAGVVLVAVDGRLDLLLPQLGGPGSYRAVADARDSAGARSADLPGVRPLGLRLCPAEPGRQAAGRRRSRPVRRCRMDARHHPDRGCAGLRGERRCALRRRSRERHPPLGRLRRLHPRRPRPVRRGRPRRRRLRRLQRHRQPRRPRRRPRRPRPRPRRHPHPALLSLPTRGVGVLDPAALPLLPRTLPPTRV